MLKQRTLKKKISTTGVGLHTGTKVTLTLRPAVADVGIVFRRVDATPPVDIPALAGHVTDTRLSTLIEKDGAKVSTIEHLMSAMAGLGIDNAYIDINGPEVPIMDGSAAPFVFLLQQAGVEEQKAAKRFIRIKSPIEVRVADKWARFDPYQGFKIDFSVEFPHPIFGAENKRVVIDFAEESYLKEISRARTFTFMQEVETMREIGLALGGSLDNAIVLDDFGVLNADGLRYDNELVKHKVLDAVGDLYLLGSPLIGAYSAFKSGHALNNKLLRDTLVQRDAWEYVTFDEEAEVPSAFGHWRTSPV